MAEGKKPWDLTSAKALDAAAEWLRKRSDAMFVLVVRGDDVAFAIDAKLRPQDALDMALHELPEILRPLIAQRVMF